MRSFAQIRCKANRLLESRHGQKRLCCHRKGTNNAGLSACNDFFESVEGTRTNKEDVAGVHLATEPMRDSHFNSRRRIEPRCSPCWGFFDLPFRGRSQSSLHKSKTSHSNRRWKPLHRQTLQQLEQRLLNTFAVNIPRRHVALGRG